MDYPKSVPNVGLVNGKFVDENTTTGQVGSLIPADWGSAVTDELLNVIRAGALEPSETDRNQLLLAIRAIIQGEIPDEEVRTTLEAYGITDAYTKSKVYSKTEVDALLKNLSALPVGSMVSFPKGTVPPGFLEVDGSVQSIATYPDLAAYLGTTFNVGNEGVGNFRLPESRGEFFRGWDHGRGVDDGRSVGSFQLDAFQGHKLRILTGDGDGRLHSPSGTGGSGTGTSFVISQGTSKELLVGDPISNGLNGEPRFGGETRPRNLAVMWCIKAWNAPINQGQIDIAALALEVQKQKPIAIVGGHKNLALSASGLSAMVSVSADQLIVGAGDLVRSLNGVNLSFSGLTVGANGLDTGVLAASTWYSVWVIWNGSAAAGLLSLSAMAPTMPAGYTHKARVGWIRTDGTANKYPLGFTQTGRRIQYRSAAGTNVPALPSMASGAGGTYSLQTPTWAAVSVLGHIPVTAQTIHLNISRSINSSGGSAVQLAPNTSYGGCQSSNPPFFDQYNVSAWGNVVLSMVLEGPSFFWAASGVGAAIGCAGWEDSL